MATAEVNSLLQQIVGLERERYVIGKYHGSLSFSALLIPSRHSGSYYVLSMGLPAYIG